MNRTCLAVVVATLVGLLSAAEAPAYSEFKSVFLKHYKRSLDKKLYRTARKAGCLVCHQGEDNDHKYNNAYGEAMAVHVGEEDKKDKKKAIAALEAIADDPSDPSDPDSPTFAELMADGQLPGGSIEDCKKPPAELADETP